MSYNITVLENGKPKDLDFNKLTLVDGLKAFTAPTEK